jgi:hypothetical protein
MRRHAPAPLALSAIVAVLSLALAGCGSTTEVTGEVTYNGKPLDKPGGTISFFGPNGVPVTAPIDTSGHYKVAGVRVGENRVTVTYPRPGLGQPKQRGPGKTGGPPATSEDSPFLTPENYALPETSKLTVVVEGGTVYNPELTGPPIK